LEDEAVTVQDHEDHRREEEEPRRGRRISRRGSTADVSTAARSEPRVEEVEGEDRRLAGRFIREKEVDMWRAAAGDLYPMEKSEDEIPMFARFAERGVALPASNFFKGLMGYYGVEYLNLNPNVFVHFCEAFLGIKPHWILFWKFFRVKPQPSASNPRVVGGAGIQMQEDAAE
jgi:hypothetical protein